MRMSPVSILCCLALGLLAAPVVVHAAPAAIAPVDEVRPLVGGKGEGNTFPGAVAPFGMVQLSPDTDDALWDTASGYEYSDRSILGFSLTHMSGTGIPDLGDFRFMPTLGEPPLVQGTAAHPDSGYRASYSHADESASAGYYRVRLARSRIQVELTASERAGLLRFTFPPSDSACVLLDLARLLHWEVIWSSARIEDGATITGQHLVAGWAKSRTLYFAARFSRPFASATLYKDGQPVRYDTYRFRSANEVAGKNVQCVARFAARDGAPILVKVAVSAVSAANALADLEAELPGWDFDGVRARCRAAWDRELSRITVEAPAADRQTFYTSLYHAFLHPNVFEDVNGEYRGLDELPHRASGYTHHALFSLWDTYRAEHPLFTLIQADRDRDMILSLLASADQSVEHLLPVWSLDDHETWCMIGYHAVPVIVDAYEKGLLDSTAERAYEAVKATADNPHYDSVREYEKLGWVPFDHENESVSKTLEYAYDDWCVARMARGLRHVADAERFERRAASWRNLFDPAYRLMRGRDASGAWRTPFQPHAYVERGDITEGTSWQYSWYVPEDVPGLVALMGGAQQFCAKLDSLFTSVPDSSLGVDDIQGRIGEYWHGNEPSHHIAYVYACAGQPWKTQARVREIIRRFYGNEPGSLSGNDDCGQMSAWYLFSALGFYPVCPGSNEYVLGSPAIARATLHLSNGHDFTVIARDQSERNVYVQSVTLDGRPWDSVYLPDRAVRAGGTLVFQLGPRPNPKWGAGARPVE